MNAVYHTHLLNIGEGPTFDEVNAHELLAAAELDVCAVYVYSAYVYECILLIRRSRIESADLTIWTVTRTK